MLKYFIYSFIVIFFVACKPHFNPPLDGKENKLVILGMVEADVEMKVSFQRCLPIYEYLTSTPSVDPMAILHHVNTGLIDSFELVQNLGTSTPYGLGFVPSSGDEFEIELVDRSSNFPTAYSSCKVPNSFQFDIVDTIGSSDRVDLFADIEIQDEPNVENYYLISGRVTQIFPTYETTRPVFFSQLDVAFENNDIINTERFVQLLLTDKSFDGETFETLLAMKYSGSSNGFIVLKVLSVEKSVYEFFKSQNTAEFIDDYFIYLEPINVTSNIENGLGFFGGAVEERDTIFFQ